MKNTRFYPYDNYYHGDFRMWYSVQLYIVKGRETVFTNFGDFDKIYIHSVFHVLMEGV